MVEKVTRKGKNPKHLADLPVAKHSLNPAEPADHKIALCARLNTCLGPKNAGQRVGTECQRGNTASGVQSPRLDNEFYQTGDLVRAEKSDLADDSSTMRGKGWKSAWAAGGIERKPAQMCSSRRRQQSRRCVTTSGGSRARVWVSQSSPKASASNFLQLKRLRPITRQLREGRAKRDCQV